MNAPLRLVPLLAPDPLAARRRAMEARLRELDGLRFESTAISLHIRPAATDQDRLAMATLLLAGTGHRIVPSEDVTRHD